ncbi:hypothetical protein ACRRTK_022537 [Alexandromys fortis]
MSAATLQNRLRPRREPSILRGAELPPPATARLSGVTRGHDQTARRALSSRSIATYRVSM